mmetsp:Transcript_143/g.520  ORF Transcript_143/g.520 Transcript_143/m.520 type:complete len:312 (-) Transcript_143:591-1526(-)
MRLGPRSRKVRRRHELSAGPRLRLRRRRPRATAERRGRARAHLQLPPPRRPRLRRRPQRRPKVQRLLPPLRRRPPRPLAPDDLLHPLRREESKARPLQPLRHLRRHGERTSKGSFLMRGGVQKTPGRRVKFCEDGGDRGAAPAGLRAAGGDLRGSRERSDGVHGVRPPRARGVLRLRLPPLPLPEDHHRTSSEDEEGLRSCQALAPRALCLALLAELLPSKSNEDSSASSASETVEGVHEARGCGVDAASLWRDAQVLRSLRGPGRRRRAQRQARLRGQGLREEAFVGEGPPPVGAAFPFAGRRRNRGLRR